MQKITLDEGAVFKILRAKEVDAQRIWEIRNDPLARQNSGNQEIIPIESHLKWFHKKYFENQGNYCYVLKNEKLIAGYCRFDHDGDRNSYLVSIALDPRYSGKGLGTRLLAMSLEKFRDNRHVTVLAEVKKNNVPSRKIFEKNGFEKYKEDEENYFFLLHLK